MRRDCRKEPVGDGCYSSTLTGFAYKDCVVTCQGENCNTGNEEVFDKAADKEEDGSYREISCYSCNSDYDEQNGVDDKPYCYATPPNQPYGKRCPVYSNSACFSSRSTHATENGETDVEHYYKGCSTFPLKEGLAENEAECVTGEANGNKVLMCDAQCTGEKDAPCNGGVTGGGGKMCFVCEGAINQLGESVGWGDLACFDRPQDYHLQLCQEGQDACITEFRADWQLEGEQVYTMRRGCGKKEPEAPETKDQCLVFSSRQLKSKQCYESCTDSNVAGCNNGTEVWEQFSTKKVETCRVCSDHIYGSNTKEDCAADEATNKKCPIYADSACFSTRLVNDTNFDQESTTFHGCSTFRTDKDKTECTTVTVENSLSGSQTSQKESCKKSCTKDECNKDALKVNAKKHYCAVCSATVNHFNRTVGEGDAGCWGENIGHKFDVECDEGMSFCLTDMEIDWAPKGDQLTTIRRSCSAEPAPEKCKSGALQTWQYKDCSTSCSDNSIHGCNTGLYQTAVKFHPDHHHGTHECFNCESHHYPSQGQCVKDLTSPEAQKDVVTCPIYAQEGCFTAITRMTDYSNKYPDDVIRGCSTFKQEYACSGWTERYLDEGEVIKELQWTSCKEACDGAQCNDQPATVPLNNQCYVCSAQRDSQGNRVGLGDQRCFGDLDSSMVEMITECGRDEFCMTSLEVDWMAKGDQVQKINRRCANVEVEDPCKTSVSLIYAAKQCYSSCEGSLCNDKVDAISSFFEPPKGQPRVERCHSCQFDEFGGSITDSQNCKSGPPSAATIKECPSWASNACFMASVVVPGDDQDQVRVYRGCSSFDQDLFGSDMKCSTTMVDTNVDKEPERKLGQSCKDLCVTGDNCNTATYPEYEAEEIEDEECPPCEDGETSSTLTSYVTVIILLSGVSF